MALFYGPPQYGNLIDDVRKMLGPPTKWEYTTTTHTGTANNANEGITLIPVVGGSVDYRKPPRPSVVEPPEGLDGFGPPDYFSWLASPWRDFHDFCILPFAAGGFIVGAMWLTGILQLLRSL